MIVVVVLAAQNYSREKTYMSRILSEKGAVLIKAVEAGARTGMMGLMWGERQVQRLIEETARLPDVVYMCLLDRQGRVLAGSPSKTVSSRLSPGFLEDLSPSETVAWRFHEKGEPPRAFEVYKYFKPMRGRDGRMPEHMRRRKPRSGMMLGSGRDWINSSSADQERIIVVGLDPKPFEEGRREDIRNTLVISGVLVLLGVAGFISMYWLQGYRAAARSLQDTSAFADQVVTSLPVGLVATDKDGKIAFSNNAVERITGLDFSRAKGQELDSMLPRRFLGLKDSLDRGESIVEKEMECRFAGDDTVPVSVSASNIMNEEGQFVGQVVILRDLGEVRRLQDEVRRKERLAAIGSLAAGVAHEIRNPLSSIKGIATYYKGKFAEHSEDRDMAGVMIEEVDRLSRAISELLEFARPAKLNLKPTNMHELLEHSIRLVQQEATAKQVEIEVLLSENFPELLVDPDRLTQCFLNLYLNALQAMESGGRLTIAGSVKDREWAVIEIQDNGPGINPENLTKIFDPYFTTKPNGAGLGLAIVHKIIEAHQGEITVRSTPGEGTVFSLGFNFQAAL